MEPSIRILYLTKDPSGSDWMNQALAFDGVQAFFNAIQDRPSFQAALREASWDVILFDMPNEPFSLRETLDSVHVALCDCPIILCASNAREAEAMEALRLGAHDYVLRGDTSRLSTVIQRERIRAERRIAQRSSMNRLMLLMGNDFNNMLTAMVGYGQMVIAMPEVSGDLRAYISEINIAAHRATRLVKQMMALAVQRPSHPHPCSLRQIIADIQSILSLNHAPGPDVMHEEPGGDEGMINADPDYVMLALLNMTLHVKEHVSQHSTVTLTMDDRVKQSAKIKDGVACVMTITFPSSVEARAWPDLANRFAWEMIQDAITMNRGVIEVRHQPDSSVITIRVIFPDLAAWPSASTLGNHRTTLPGGAETILVVEDDDMVRRMTVRFLRTLGYRVLESNDPQDVLKEWNRAYKNTDLLITDLVMPGMNGHDLVKRLKNRKHAFRYIYVTGFADDAYAAFGIDCKEDLLLRKPFDREQLASAVRATLDQA